MSTINNGSGNKVLVTGGSGLLGRELIQQLLENGDQVIAIEHETPINILHPLLQIETCSLGDIVRLQELAAMVSDVYHCAGKVSFLPSDKYALLKINVEGTANVVEACRAAGIRKLVHVSSVASLGETRNGAKISEDMQWSDSINRSVYGESKYLGELEVWKAAAEGMDVVIVNPSIILGEGDWNEGSTALFKNVYNEFPWYSEGVTGFVDVKDVASLMILLMNSDLSNERYIISAENISYKTLFEKIAQKFSKKPPHKKVSPFIASLAWRWEALKYMLTRKKPLLTKETARSAQAVRFYDHSKILSAFPQFRFRPVDETIIRVATALQQKVNNP